MKAASDYVYRTGTEEYRSGDNAFIAGHSSRAPDSLSGQPRVDWYNGYFDRRHKTVLHAFRER